MEEIMKKGIETRQGVFTRYNISSLGEVFDTKTGKPVHHYFDERGYHRVRLVAPKFSNLKTKTYRVHRLVAYNFYPKECVKAQVDHKNCNKDDNRLENLEWVTNDENMRRATINGLRPRGESSGNNKYSEKLMKAVIEELFIKGSSVSYIVDKYHIHEHTVRAVRDREYWNWLIYEVLAEHGMVGKQLAHRKRHTRELMERVITALFIYKHSVPNVAKEYNLKKSTVNNIKRRVSWNWLTEEVTKKYFSSIGVINVRIDE